MRALGLLCPALSSLTPASSSCSCTCIYGDHCWPSALVFSSLESQLSHPLLYLRPIAAACYPVDAPSGNCSALAQVWGDGNWRSNQPGAMEASNFETYMFKNGTIDACFLNTTVGIPCNQGSVPIIGVNATTPEDVQAAVRFAVQNDLKLVVKNTGYACVTRFLNTPSDVGLRHDFLGRSAARGSFVIWTHYMKNITYSPTFLPQSAPQNESYDGKSSLFI